MRAKRFDARILSFDYKKEAPPVSRWGFLLLVSGQAGAARRTSRLLTSSV